MRKIALLRSVTRKFYLSEKYSNKQDGDVFVFDEGMLQSCVNIAVTSPPEKLNIDLLKHTKLLVASRSSGLVIYLSPQENNWYREFVLEVIENNGWILLSNISYPLLKYSTKQSVNYNYTLRKC